MTLHLNTSTCTGVFEEVVIYSHNMIANVQHLEINSWLQCVWKRWDDRCSSYQHYVTRVFKEVVICRHNEINTYLQCAWKRWDHQAESSSATRVMCSANSAGGSNCQVLCRNSYKIWNLQTLPKNMSKSISTFKPRSHPSMNGCPVCRGPLTGTN